jgi:hypothetical protein
MDHSPACRWPFWGWGATWVGWVSVARWSDAGGDVDGPRQVRVAEYMAVLQVSRDLWFSVRRMQIGSFVISLAAITLAIVSFVSSRASANKANLATNRSADAAERQTQLAEADAIKYRIPWRLEHIEVGVCRLVNDSDDEGCPRCNGHSERADSPHVRTTQRATYWTARIRPIPFGYWIGRW